MLLKKELTEYNRYQAFATHMAISLVIFFILLVCITQYWYPGILFDTGNGWKAIGMIVGIDLILGPLLTLIVFNPKKSSLKFDLSVIALVQTAALIYGTWTIHQTRPIALAFVNTHFITIYANNNIASGIIEQVKQYNTHNLYYLFNESNEEALLSVNFMPYKQYSKQVNGIKGPYRIGNLIKLDPLVSTTRYIQIDVNTGDVVKFVKK